MKYRFRRRFLYILLVVSGKIFLLLPYNIAVTLGGACGRAVYMLLGRYRSLTISHLEYAFGSALTRERIRLVSKSVFVNLGMCAAEILSLPKIKHRLNRLIDIEGKEKIDRVISAGSGAVIVSAHLGNWELIPVFFSCNGYKSNVIARPIYYEKYNEWISSLRSGMGINVIYRTDSAKKIIRLLKRKELLGIVADQDVDSLGGVFVDFFGKKAYTPSAPVKLAQVCRVPIIPVFIIRSGLRHTIRVEDPIYINDISDPEWVVNYTKKWSDVVESYVRRYPEQWVWMHRRWKTKAVC
ncbi:MAG: lysophospholipid acyltransferase family protein [Candidatus Omnitrophica bacterium]|nr:lysophospholipid acyltransferase family protein [Candidatus Omnitrophota bacterium]